MELQIKNEHLFFALGGIWETLDYKFKYNINQLVTANSDDTYIQTIDVTPVLVRTILNYVNLIPQGVAREINPEMFSSILPQVQAAAALGDPEAIEILQDMNNTVINNNEIKNNLIITGKNKILA